MNKTGYFVTISFVKKFSLSHTVSASPYLSGTKLRVEPMYEPFN